MSRVMSRSRFFVPLLTASLALSACSTSSNASTAASTRPDASCLDDSAASCANADLAGLDLSGRSLQGRVLSGARLDGADLTDADLTGADLLGASLVGATLPRVRLDGADLAFADLRRVDLSAASLVGADLREANLYGAKLPAADLSGALLVRTTFHDADLSGVDASYTVVSRTDLRGATLSGSTWTGAVVRDEDEPPSALAAAGALVCGFTTCQGQVTSAAAASTSAPDIAVPADAFETTFLVVSRFALSYAEAPTVLSRGSALSTLAALGVYDADPAFVVERWTHPDGGLAPGLRDVAALYAMVNTSVALRYDPLGEIRSGRLRVAVGARDVTLWQLTRDHPEVRPLIIEAATRATASALARAAQDGFAERPTTTVGELSWAPTQPGFAPALDPGWGTLVNYLPDSPRCRAGAPTDEQMNQAEDVLAGSKTLTEDQKAAARFWDDERLRTTTPVGHWQNIATAEFAKRLDRGEASVEDAIRALARLHLSLADTMILVWRDKYAYGTARPITLLQSVEPGWNSYLGNPPFPAYPSGHAAVSALGGELLTAMLGEYEFVDNGAFENPSGMRVFNIAPRKFPNFRAAGVEGGLSRIWGGIHIMDDYDGGRRIGVCVAGLWDDQLSKGS